MQESCSQRPGNTKQCLARAAATGNLIHVLMFNTKACMNALEYAMGLEQGHTLTSLRKLMCLPVSRGPEIYKAPSRGYRSRKDFRVCLCVCWGQGCPVELLARCIQNSRDSAFLSHLTCWGELFRDVLPVSHLWVDLYAPK